LPNRFKEVIVPDRSLVMELPAGAETHEAYAYCLFNLDVISTDLQILSVPETIFSPFASRRSRVRKPMHSCTRSSRTKSPGFTLMTSKTSRLARSPTHLLFAGISLSKPEYFTLWRALNPDPTVKKLFVTIQYDNRYFGVAQECNPKKLSYLIGVLVILQHGRVSNSRRYDYMREYVESRRSLNRSANSRGSSTSIVIGLGLESGCNEPFSGRTRSHRRPVREGSGSARTAKHSRIPTCSLPVTGRGPASRSRPSTRSRRPGFGERSKSRSRVRSGTPRRCSFGQSARRRGVSCGASPAPCSQRSVRLVIANSHMVL